MQDQGTLAGPVVILAIIAIVIIIFLASSKGKRKSVGPTTAARPKENYLKAKVHQVIDGDTIIVSKSWRKIKIRLDAIDCPEQDQHWGDTAKYGHQINWRT